MIEDWVGERRMMDNKKGQRVWCFEAYLTVRTIVKSTRSPTLACDFAIFVVGFLECEDVERFARRLFVADVEAMG